MRALNSSIASPYIVVTEPHTDGKIVVPNTIIFMRKILNKDDILK